MTPTHEESQRHDHQRDSPTIVEQRRRLGRPGSLAEKRHGQRGHDDPDDLVLEVFQCVDLQPHR
jgi:hypothetical protein